MLTLTEMLGASMWARNLEAEHLRRVTAEITRRDVPAGALDVCVVMGQLLQVDLGGVRLRETAQTRRRVIAAVDVL